MAKTSFVDNNSKLGDAFVRRDYSNLNAEIEENRKTYTCDIEYGESVYAFNVTINKPLSDIYYSEFRVVRFVLKNVDTLHSKEQMKHFVELFEKLDKYMSENPAYYNIRIPTHFVDAVKAYNYVFKNDIFCGGTVEWIVSGKTVEINKRENVEVFWANKEFIDINRGRLKEISFKSFQSYQGQYHISDVTEKKAGVIYEKWLEDSFDNYKGNVLVVTYNKDPAAFIMYGEDECSVEAVVGAVDSNYRKIGAYRMMISTGINYATEKKKHFVTSTQFDNFIVQGVWASLGLKPFYSIYNIHLDRRLYE